MQFKDRLITVLSLNEIKSIRKRYQKNNLNSFFIFDIK